MTFSWVHWLIIISAAINLLGAFAYIRDTVAGRTKPNRVSWLMWTLAPFIGTAAAYAAGADFWSALRIFIVGFPPLLILITSFLNGQSYWRLNSFDLLCGALSLLALLIWGFADSPRSAVLLAVIADGFACLPTVIKAWRYPETETGSAYIASFVGAIIVIPAVPLWNIENAAFQIYLLIGNALLLFCVYRKWFGFGK